MPSPAPALASALAEELDRPASAAAGALVEAIRARHGDAVAAVLLYGSCLRNRTDEGVFDFYVLVDGYRACHGSRGLALLNAVLPPSVLYLETTHGATRLRAKYAVMTVADFARAAAPAGLDCRVWFRFCQPAVLVWRRDDATQHAVVTAVAEATLTMVDWMRVWLPGDAPTRRFSSEELWQGGFRESYRSELRGESDDTVAGLHASAPARYRQITRLALAVLEARGQLRLPDVGPEASGSRFEVGCDPSARARARRAWCLRRPLAKAVAVLGLLKTAFTFDDWLPYAIFKLERHGAEPIELSDRQRRHPLLFGWPVIFRLLRRGVLR